MTMLLDRPELAQPRLSRRVRRWLAISGAALLVLLLGWLIGFSSVFGVGSVQVSGNRFLTAAQVRAAAAVVHGTPLARLDVSAVRARVAQLPEVRSVTVSRSLPSTVKIEIAERVAAGYRSTAGSVVLVDGTGVAFRTVAAPPAGLPLLAETSDVAAATAMAAVAGSLPAKLAAVVSKISATSAESVTLTLTRSRTVLWGGTDRSADKARLLLALLSRPGSYFDLSDPSSVITR